MLRLAMIQCNQDREQAAALLGVDPEEMPQT